MSYLIGSESKARFASTYAINSSAGGTLLWLVGNPADTAAVASGAAATLELYISSWGAQTNIKCCIYDETNAGVLLESVVIPSSAGTGAVSVALTGSTSIVSANNYRLGIYTEDGDPITLFSDTAGLTLRSTSASGSYATPQDPAAAGSYDSANEFYWAIQDAAAATPTLDTVTDPLVAGSTGNVATVTGLLETSTLKSLKLGGVSLPITSWGNNAQSQSFPPNILQPLAVGGPSSTPNLFADSFESQDLSASQASVNTANFAWGADNRVSIVTGAAGANQRVWATPTVYNDSRDWTAKTGDYSLRFNYVTGEYMSEQRFSMDAQSDIWLRYWVRVPVNFQHGTLNNKWLALWTNVYDGPGDITLQTRPTAAGCKLVMQDGGVAVGEADVYQDFIDESRDQGRWMQFVIRAVEASSGVANDGVIQIWRRWEDEETFTQIGNKTNAQFYEGGSGVLAGYLMGWANDPYDVDTEWLVDNFEMSTGSLL